MYTVGQYFKEFCALQVFKAYTVIDKLKQNCLWTIRGDCISDLDTFREKLLIQSDFTTLYYSWLILDVRHEKVVSLAYSVLSSTKRIKLRYSEKLLNSLLYIKKNKVSSICLSGMPRVIKDDWGFTSLMSTYWARFYR